MDVLPLLSLICVVPIGLLAWSGYRLSSLFTSTNHAEIAFPPHELHMSEVVLAILAMIFKSIFKRTSEPNIKQDTKALDAMTLSSPFSLNEEDIARYHQAVGSPDRTGQLSDLALLLFLSAVTEPAMLLLLASPRCPINPLGALNVRNRFEVLRPELCQTHLFMRQHSAGLVAQMRKESRTVKRGVEYDLEVAIMVPDQARLDGVELIPVFRQVFTMLEFRRTKATEKVGTGSKTNDNLAAFATDKNPSKISFSSSGPLKWAALCKDYNLIHLAGLAAKLFGLPGKLAHGNHVVAKAIQQLEDDKKVQLSHGNPNPIFMEVQFKRPVVVPNALIVQVQQRTSDEREIFISCKDRENVTVKLGRL